MYLNFVYTEKVSLNLVQTLWFYYKMDSQISRDELKIVSIDVYRRTNTPE